MKFNIAIIALFILVIPSFWRMLKPGIFSMHDMHIFRLYQYEKCILDFQIPCRWSPDVSFEYGQPLFNFYGQLPYLTAEIFRIVGFSLVDSLKLTFIFTLIGSAIAMFLLAKNLWKDNLSALFSSVLYIYAPYRAVDIYVRGALNEAFSFVLFPLIVYFFNSYVITKSHKDLILLSISFFLLIITHNLSVVMFLLFFSIWAFYYLYVNKAFHLSVNFLVAALLSIGLSAFYLLPMIFESQFINLNNIKEDYFNFNNHFTTIYQLLISRYWDYGGSGWGNSDRVSLSVGHLQWIIPSIILCILLFTKKLKNNFHFIFLYFLAWFMLLMTHNKSVLVWNFFTPIQYIQFPWRFLGLAVFSFSISAGIFPGLIKNKKIRLSIVSFLITLIISLNFGYFFEDLWYKYDDKTQFQKLTYNQQFISSSPNDYWPKYGLKFPTAHAPKDPIFISGSGTANKISERSNTAIFKLNIYENSIIELPIVYFPGWRGYVAGNEIPLSPGGDLGLIHVNVAPEDDELTLKFTNTFIRNLGNIISVITLVIVIFYIKLNKNEKN